MTRADKLRFSVSYALLRLKIDGRNGRRLTDAERNAVAERVVATLRLYGDQWRLDEEIPMELAPSWDWTNRT